MFLIIIYNIIVYFFGYYLVYKKGIRENIIFAFSWFIFTVYYFLTPLYFYSIGRATIWGDSFSFDYQVGEIITDYYDDGLLYFASTNLLFLFGYFSIPNKRKKFLSDNISYQSNKYIKNIFLTSFTLVISNFVISGINPLAVFLGNSEDTLFGVVGATSYLNNFTDSLITCLVLAVLFKIKKEYIVYATILCFILFSLMGFRYRIIMTLVGWAIVYLFNSKVSLNKIFNLKTLLFALSMFYCILFITKNRYSFINSGSSTQIVFDPTDFDIVSTLAEQTRGALDDINIIKYYDQHENPKYDNGISFLYFIVRALPRYVVGNDFKDALYPPPSFPIILEAYNLPFDGKSTGEAPLHYAYFMIAGGLPTLLLGGFLSGFLIKLSVYKKNYLNPKDSIFMIIVCMVLFQWYTRGYFPAAVDNFFFLMIPYWLFFKFAKNTNGQ